MQLKVVSQKNIKIFQQGNVDVIKLKSVILSYKLGTCLANSGAVIYVLRALGEQAKLMGMFRTSEDQPFQYLVSSNYGEIDVEVYDDEEDQYEETRIVSETKYQEVLEQLEQKGVIQKLDKLIIKGELV